jgi:hypothetical protein
MDSNRSSLVTALAWLIIVASAVLIPVSTISFLMILVRSYGTATWDPLGFLQVVVAPPLTLAAGIGLLRRKAWARVYVVALLMVAIATTVFGMARPPRPRRTYVSPTGVPTTVLESEPKNLAFSVVVLVASGALLLALTSKTVRSEF